VAAVVNTSNPVLSKGRSSLLRKPKDGNTGMREAAMQNPETESRLTSALGSTVTARRLTVLGTTYEASAVYDTIGGGFTSNIQAAVIENNNIIVTAGVKYPKFKLKATSGLGSDASKIRLKLLKSDYDLSFKSCKSEAVKSQMSTPPFNGDVDVAKNVGALSHDFLNVVFPTAGIFKLCYTADGVKWEELPSPTITVLGAASSSLKVFCSKTIMEKDICRLDYNAVGCQCKGRVDGFQWSGGTLLKTGLPTPITVAGAKDSIWKTRTNANSAKCGDGTGPNGIPFSGNGVSTVENGDGYEIHSFGHKFQNVDVAVWKMCYCANYDHNVIADHSSCDFRQEQDFPQLIGTIITTEVASKMGALTVTVYPTLKFSLVLLCGSDGVSGDGGCEQNKDVRYKIVEHKPENDNLYFEESSGCRTLEQAKTQVLPGKLVGGHIGPENCQRAALCVDEPEIESKKTPTWDNVQIDASYQNRFMIKVTFDVCYCDRNCENNVNWFKAGEIEVKPTKVSLIDKNDQVQKKPVVNTNYYVQIEGPSGPGSWTATGSKSREMKILSDPNALVDKDACLTVAQPDMVSGHPMGTGVIDYAEPSHPVIDPNGRLSGFKYGEVRAIATDERTAKPNIKIKQAGHIAVCYCDNECNLRGNWAVFGRALVRGPKANQAWKRTTNVPFNLDVQGYGLEVTNYLMIVDPTNELSDCGRADKAGTVYGPIGNQGMAMMSSGPRINKIERDPEGFGTIISFEASHGLQDGDVIEIKDVRVIVDGGDQEKEDQINTAHTVYVVCDEAGPPACYKILIQVVYNSQEFPPSLGFDTASWMKTSVQTYEKIRIARSSPEGRGYVVCWSQIENDQVYFVGQAGKITVFDPVEMPTVDSSIVGGSALLSLTTVQADVTAPLIITFIAGDRSQYAMAENSMQLKLVFQSELKIDTTGVTTAQTIPTLEPKMYDGSGINEDGSADELHEAHQGVCGRFFLEMWTNAPRGFPQPKGCYFSKDKTNPNQQLWEFYIVFNERNHLVAQAEYQIVMNGQATDQLGPDIPSDGAVHVWSLDDTVKNLDGVVERGRAFPKAKRTPAEATNALATDSHFHETEGFKVTPDEGTQSGVLSMTRYCKYDDGTEQTPNAENSCQPCDSEAKCGNSDPAYTWCISPIDASCPQVAGGDYTQLPAFVFQLRGKTGAPIQSGHIVRVFMQPLTQWYLGTTCYVRIAKCSDGVDCGEPHCEVESVVRGKEVDNSAAQINVLKVTMHALDSAIGPGEDDRAEFAVGNLPLPSGGFFPVTLTAELQKSENVGPVYWGGLSATGATKLYFQPKTTVAAIVTKVGDGNANYFVSTETTVQTNTIYLKIVSGATWFSPSGGDMSMDIELPEDYKCGMIGQGKPAPSSLKLFDDLEPKLPTGNGTLGGNPLSWTAEGTWTSQNQAQPAKCTFTFSKEMVVYAGASLYAELIVQNPKTPRLKYDFSGINSWSLTVSKAERGKTHTTYKKVFSGDAPNFGPNLSVLGKLGSVVIAPTNFGVGQKNMMMIFFKTEQEVGTREQKQTEIWVDAPPGYDFGHVCKVEHLENNYYVPVEPPELPTLKIPTGSVIICNGGLSRVGEITYNRARIRTTGRLQKGTFYGFQLEVRNGPNYYGSKSPAERWSVWTYMIKEFDVIGEEFVAGVDGTNDPVPFYQNHPSMARRFTTERRMSFGAYLRNIPHYNFGVTVGDLLPSSHDGTSTITIFPIVVEAPSEKNIRVVAPAGFRWQFEQSEFKYRSKLTGAPEGEYVDGAEADVPLSLVPNRPIAEPYNELKIDYMKAAWKADVKYGMMAKIMIPVRSPTASANIYTIEFGYDEDEMEDRLEAGATEAKMVQKLINVAVNYLTNIVGRNNTLWFRVQTVSKIPFAGGLVIIGPPNFQFCKNPNEEGGCSCWPKPLPGYPEFPPDATCVVELTRGDARPVITMTAGHGGIPVKMYRFYLQATNPPNPVSLENRDAWTFHSYRLVSKKESMDASTSVEGFLINNVMPAGNLIHAVKRECTFVDQLDVTQLAVVQTKECDMEDWQYHTPRGLRDDRPRARNALIFTFTLSQDSLGGGILTIRAPEGFMFEVECLPVITDEAKVFNAINTDGQTPTGFSQQPRQYSPWPKDVVVTACKGTENIAELTISPGLKKFKKYIFRMPIASNPTNTPNPNKFILEYNDESSEPFDGFEIWAFTDGEIIPQTTSVSLRPPASTENLVSIQFRPRNTIPMGGRIRIVAPSGFVIATKCDAQLRLHEKSQKTDAEIALMDTAEKIAYDQWSQFGPDDIECKGETKPTYKAQLKLLYTKILQSDMLYVMSLLVINPQSMNREASDWYFESYEDDTPESILDGAYIEGFPINYVVPHFMYTEPASKNALADVVLKFTMSFPQTVAFGDSINIVAPVGYKVNTLGNNKCIQYKHITGPLVRTQPLCEQNMITWKLQDERVAPNKDVVFNLQIKNPDNTPLDNLFKIRQIGDNGVQKSSKVIPGYLIIPDLKSVQISNVAPVHPCRPVNNVITQRTCTATDSFATIGVTFTPVREAAYVRIQGHIDGQDFSFLESAVLVDSGVEAEVIARTEEFILVQSPLLSGIEASFGIDRVQNPPVAGISFWSVTTYIALPEEQTMPTQADRADEKLDLTGFEVLRYNEILPTTSVNPPYYKEINAQIRFEVKMGRTIEIGEIITITRPMNYTMLENPKIKTYQKGVAIGEAGLDVFRRWNAKGSWENPETYYFVMESVVPEKELFVFSLQANLPAVPEMQRHWFIRSWKLLPVLDEDGRVVDDSQAPYPFLNRELKETSSNDGSYAGFHLIGKIPFNIVPERQTPGARVLLTLEFGLEAPIVAEEPDGIKLVLFAPSGFRFEASCRSGLSTQFRQCIGINNQARLTASRKRLTGTSIQVGLAAFNPTETPEFNRWELELYKDVPITSSKYSSKSAWDGYEIRPMDVIYRGNNQLAEGATGFFSFTPVRDLVRRGYVEFAPPPDLGYLLNCQGVKVVSLPETPLCLSEEADKPLRLEFTNSTLLKGKTYTIGVGVVNPGAPPPPEQNKFSIMLLDIDMNAIDGNAKVDGLQLRSIPLRVVHLGWSSAEPQEMARIEIRMIVLHPIAVLTIDEILIVSPEGVMYSDASLVSIGPDQLPLVESSPITVEGNNVKIKLRKDRGISPGGYNVQFQVKNPTALPPDNTWMVFAMKGKEKVLTHVLAGYVYGQPSDVEVASVLAVSEACRSRYYSAAILMLALLSTALVGI
jgi:hypothetical protein